MSRFFAFSLCVLMVACATQTTITNSDFLAPYVQQLKKELSHKERKTIATMAEPELALLHFDLGMEIRNRWLRGNRDPKLVQYFKNQGIDHPDYMSRIIIRALWQNLNDELTPKEREAVEVKRELVERRRQAYVKAESECEAQLTAASGRFEACYEAHGLPSANPLSRDPFWRLKVGRNGKIQKIEFPTGGSRSVRPCLEEILQTFVFSPFSDDDSVTLYILEFPRCRVSERDRLHSR
jgi:hypothetical protein